MVMRRSAGVEIGAGTLNGDLAQQTGAGRVIEPGRRPAKVRVAPGETLETLAERFYGDRSMATRLYEANRDLVRNPALVVAGMELRLP